MKQLDIFLKRIFIILSKFDMFQRELTSTVSKEILKGIDFFRLKAGNEIIIYIP